MNKKNSIIESRSTSWKKNVMYNLNLGNANFSLHIGTLIGNLQLYSKYWIQKSTLGWGFYWLSTTVW